MSDTSASSDVTEQEPVWLRFVYMIVFGFFGACRLFRYRSSLASCSLW